MIGSAKIAKIRVLPKLGLGNLFRVGAYRARLRLGVHPAQSVAAPPLPPGDFFAALETAPVGLPPSLVWSSGPWAFGRDLERPSEAPPDWHANIITGGRIPAPDQRWDKLPEFADSISEIKTVWEASRFDWVLAFAQQAANGDDARVGQLNAWLDDWSAHNPPYCGPNWMCAQETAIRVMKLAIAGRVLGNQQPSDRLAAFIVTHLRRIAPTTSYAIGQDNNHATSEAAALFIGGLWLATGARDGGLAREGRRHAAVGRKLLERSVRRLVLPDGGFAQYSMVYHRLMLDSLSLCVLFGREWGEAPFAADVGETLARATDWLDAMIFGEDGDVPNIGSNDGAWLLPLGTGAFRDFRPSVALGAALFKGKRRFRNVASARDLCAWLRVGAPTGENSDDETPVRTDFLQSGLYLCAAGATRLALVAPRPRFRPHQCDPLHLDIWHAGRPVFCDSGTFSYAQSAPPPDPWLGSVAAHNTVAFEDKEPMPRLGRFLLGDWLTAQVDHHDSTQISASCCWGGMRHRRTAQVTPGRVVVLDEIHGRCEYATLRWKTPDSDLTVVGNEIVGRRFRLRIVADGHIAIGLRQAWVSPTYLALQPVQQIEIRFKPEGNTEISTEIELTG